MISDQRRFQQAPGNDAKTENAQTGNEDHGHAPQRVLGLLRQGRYAVKAYVEAETDRNPADHGPPGEVRELELASGMNAVTKQRRHEHAEDDGDAGERERDAHAHGGVDTTVR